MPNYDHIIKLPGCTIVKVEEGDPLVFHVKWRWKIECPACGSKRGRKKDRYERSVWHHTIGTQRTMLRFSSYKYLCLDCGRYFRQRLPGLLPWYRSTESLKQEVFTYHTEGLSQKDLSSRMKKSASTIERWYHQYYYRGNQEIKQRECPRVLGIDEHSFSRKEGYATTFCDLRKHRVFDVVKGKSEEELKEYILSLTGREKVQVVCIDMSSSYRSLIRKYFPNAKIVADRFHVIRLINHHFTKTIQTIDETLKYGKLTKLLQMNPDNLLPEQQAKLTSYLDKHPPIAALYRFKIDFIRLLKHKHQTKRECKALIPEFLSQLKELSESGFTLLRTLAKTMTDWKEEIARMWRFTKNNGITEGFHRKMKLIQRRAYGFKNFENYRLRVRVLCG